MSDRQSEFFRLVGNLRPAVIRLFTALITSSNGLETQTVPITSCKRCARLPQLCKPFQSRSHWEFPICTSGEVETGFLSQFAPLGKRWRRLTENLVLSLFDFVHSSHSYSRITHAPALLVRGFVSRKKGARGMGEETKEGENNNNNK